MYMYNHIHILRAARNFKNTPANNYVCHIHAGRRGTTRYLSMVFYKQKWQ